MHSPRPLPPLLASLHQELGIPDDYAPSRCLDLQPEAGEAALVEIGPNPDGRPVRLVAGTAAAWRSLQTEAARDGIELIAVSGFRSVARQAGIIREKLEAGQPIDVILQWIAAPGFSEHHTGRALDIGSPNHCGLEESFALTPAFDWLQRYAPHRGFRLSYPRGNPHGIAYEPWHWFHRA